MYGALKISKGVKHRLKASQEAEKARQAAEAAEEKIRFDEARKNQFLEQYHPVVKQFMYEFNEKNDHIGHCFTPTSRPERASKQCSTETSPLPFSYEEVNQRDYSRHLNEQASAQLASGRTSLSTERTSSPFRVIIEVKDRTESPLQKRFLEEEREADPKRSIVSTILKNVSHGFSSSTLDTPELKRVQSPIQEIPQSKYQPRAHSSMSYEDDISDHGSEGFHEDMDHFPMDIDMDIE
jgi:hypothetical protein